MPPHLSYSSKMEKNEGNCSATRNAILESTFNNKALFVKFVVKIQRPILT